MTGLLERLLDGPAHRLAAAVSAREVRAREVAGAALRRAARSREIHGAFLHVAGDEAVDDAAGVDRRVAAGETLPLAGVPIAVKDNVHVAGMPTTAGSRVLGTFVPPEDATCVARLRRAGCVVVGKTSCDELGMGSTNETLAFGPVRNPWEPTRVPGGSSGGSAAAVAGRAVPLAVGTDTGGSVRLPAAFCGLVGVRPTFGRVSRSGLVAFASSFDQAGPLARDVRDAALALAAMSGADSRDATSLPEPPPDLLSRLDDGVAGLRVGLLDEAGEGLDPDAAAALASTARLLSARGATVRPLRLPRLSLGVASYYLISAAEASSNLARFDGVRFGARVAGADSSALVRATRADGFGDEVKRRILLGTFALSEGHRGAWYERAQRVRARIALDLADAFRACDLLLSPTAPGPAFPIGERTGDPLSLYLTDVFTVPASLAGLPAVSVPAGLSRDRLPVGVHLAGPAGSEALLLAVARDLEAATGPWPAAPDVIR